MSSDRCSVMRQSNGHVSGNARTDDGGASRHEGLKRDEVHRAPSAACISRWSDGLWSVERQITIEDSRAVAIRGQSRCSPCAA